MDTEALLEPEIKVLATYPLINDHIFTNEHTTVDMVSTAGFNIPTGSRLYINENPTDYPFLFVGIGYFSTFDFNDNTATFALDRHPRFYSTKNIIKDIMSNSNDYELYAKLSVIITKNEHIKYDKSGSSFFFLKNKRYTISKETQRRIVALVNLL